MDAEQGQGEITRLLRESSQGDADAMARLVPVIYDELRALAASYLRRERPDHTLQPTALANEAYIRLVDQRVVQWNNRSHFFGIAAKMMRRILVDHARAHRAGKRGGDAERVPLDEASAWTSPHDVDLIALDIALDSLARHDERKAKVVEMRFFGGMSVDETADVLGVASVTVMRDWTMAKAYLLREMTGSA
jgi:RNA polymerase sigma factor (TIGR02999 family)